MIIAGCRLNIMAGSLHSIDIISFKHNTKDRTKDRTSISTLLPPRLTNYVTRQMEIVGSAALLVKPAISIRDCINGAFSAQSRRVGY